MMREISKTNKHLKLYICMDDITLEGTDERFTTLQDSLKKVLTFIWRNRSFVDAEIDRNAMSFCSSHQEPQVFQRV